MSTKLEEHALAHLTAEERELLKDEGDMLLEDATSPDSGVTLHGRVIGADSASEPVQERASRRMAHDDDDTELRSDPSPIFDTRIPVDLPQRLAALDEEKAALVSRFDDGEITAREYSDGLQAITDRRDDLNWQKRKAQFAEEQREAAINKNWEKAVERFMTSTGKDIAAKGEGALLAFDSYVKRVTVDPANARLSDRAQLAKAHKAFLADFGKLPASGSPRASSGSRAAADDAPARGGGGDAMARALAVNDQKAFDRAFARMSPEEQDEWLR